MSDYSTANISVPDAEEKRRIYIHQGHDVPWGVVEQLGRHLEYNAGLIFDGGWSGYTTFTSGFDDKEYRLYEQDRETFFVELTTYHA